MEEEEVEEDERHSIGIFPNFSTFERESSRLWQERVVYGVVCVYDTFMYDIVCGVLGICRVEEKGFQKWIAEYQR